MPHGNGTEDFVSIMELITFRDSWALVVPMLRFNVLLDRPLSHLMEQINP